MKSIKKLAVIMLSAMVLFGTMTVPTMAAAKSPTKQTFNTVSMKTAGKKIVYINGIGRYAGFYKTVAYTINPAVQKNVKVSRSSVAVKRGKATTIKLTKAKAAKATWTSSNSKAVKVSKTGKIIVAKNAKKGKYTVKVTVKLANHKTVTRTVKVTVK